MTRIDFYVLAESDSQARLVFAARLSEKAMARGLRTLIVANKEDCAALDELLWTFRPEAFVPHSAFAALGEAAGYSPKDSVILSTQRDEPSLHDYLINLLPTVPAYFSRFKRAAEVVVQSPDILKSTRSNYSFYKDRGYAVNTHKL